MSDERTIDLTEIRDDLAESIREMRVISNVISQLQSDLNKSQARKFTLTGKQEALSKLFLNGEELTLQEAFDQNLHGIKEAVDPQKES